MFYKLKDGLKQEFIDAHQVNGYIVSRLAGRSFRGSAVMAGDDGFDSIITEDGDELDVEILHSELHKYFDVVGSSEPEVESIELQMIIKNLVITENNYSEIIAKINKVFGA